MPAPTLLVTASDLDVRIVDRFRRASRAASHVIVCVGVLVMIGWIFDIGFLKWIHPSWSAMKVNTALSFIFLGIGLLTSSSGQTRISLVAYSLVIMVAGATSLEYLAGTSMGIDEFLFVDSEIHSARPGRMAPTTAVSFLCLALSGLLVDSKFRWRPSQLLAGLSLAAALLAVCGYLYDVQALYKIGPYAGVALLTALCSILAGLALLFLRPEVGLMVMLSTRSSAGILLRRLVPTIVVVPVTVGWVRLLGQRAGLYDTSFGVALLVLSNVVAMGAMTWVVAASLHRSDRARSVAMEDLGRAELQFRSLVEAAPDAIIMVDQHRRIALVNEVGESLFGFSRSEIVGQSIERLFATGWRDQPLLDEAAEGDRGDRAHAARRSMVGRRQGGVDFVAEVGLSLLNSSDGIRTVAFVRDVTERERIAELRRRNAQLAQENQRMQETSRLKSAFLANMSHELRTPLNAVIGFASLMHKEKVGPVAPLHKEYLGDILSGAHHLLQIINDILDLAKIEAGGVEVHPTPFPLVAVVKEMKDALRLLADERRVDIQFDATEESIGEAILDPRLFRQILYNLLSNAIKFTPAGGRVVVRMAPMTDERFLLEVEDTGIGIKQEDMGRLFVEFQQLDQGRSKRHGGTGLGLALTKHLIEAQGGTITVSSSLGVGSTFRVILPRAVSAKTPHT